jgi:DNA-binding transcriptional ArsR family regulator
MYEYDDDPDEAFSRACEEYLFEVLTDCPDDQICWVLDRVDEPKRQAIIQKIRDAIAFYEPEPAFKPTPDALCVLKVLATAETTMIQEDIEVALKKAGTPVSRRTFGSHLRRLLEVGLVHYPSGERKGAAITSKGLQYVPQSQCE